jgi:2-keto-4-pentenoate hydratase
MDETWTEATFLAAIAKVGGPDDVASARTLLSWCQRHTRVEWGKGDEYGYLMPVVMVRRLRVVPFSPWVGPKSVGVEVNFESLKKHHRYREEVARRELLETLRCVPGIELIDAYIGGRPSIPMRVLANNETRREFLVEMERVVDTLHA